MLFLVSDSTAIGNQFLNSRPGTFFKLVSLSLPFLTAADATFREGLTSVERWSPDSCGGPDFKADSAKVLVLLLTDTVAVLVLVIDVDLEVDFDVGGGGRERKGSSIARKSYEG